MPGLAMVMLLVGIIGTIVGFFFVDPDVFYRSYLVGYMFWFNIAAGSLFFLMVQHLSGGHWGVVSRRVFESSAGTFIALAALLAPALIFGAHDLFHWTHADAVANDPILQEKAPYLNLPFFWVRFVIYFVILAGLGMVLTRLSTKQDETGDPRLPGKMANVSGPGLVLLFLVMTFASIDWLLSLEPHYYSTMYGPIVMAGQALGAMSFVIAVLITLARFSPVNKMITSGHLHDLGKFLLATTMFWAYVNFSQFLITWSANLAEETPYYLRRMTGGWQYLSGSLIVLAFFVPFLLLLNRDLKRNPNTLVVVAIGVIIMRFFDLVVMIMPSVSHDHHGHLDFGGIIVAAMAVLGVGGIWLMLFMRNLSRRSLLPVNDPYLQEALEFRGGH